MASGSKKKERESYWDRQARTAYDDSKKKSPLELELERRNLETLSWGKGDGKDIRSLSTLNPYLQLADTARQRADSEQLATGGLALSGGGGSGYAEKLRDMRRKETDREAGAMVENAYSNAVLNAQGQGMQLANMDLNRRLSNAQFAGGMWNSAAERANRPGFWSQLAQGVITSGIGAVGSYYSGAGA